jgi:hypothetical protein
MKSLLAVLAFAAILVLVASACGGDGGVGGGEDDLRDTVAEAFQAFIDDDNARFYTFSSSEFRDKCPFVDFVGVLTRSKAFLGDISEAEVVVDDVRIEESRGFVDSHIELDGVEIISSDDEDHFPDYWIVEDGEWKSTDDHPTPCDPEGRDNQ